MIVCSMIVTVLFLFFPMACLLSTFVSSAIVATPFRRFEFTKSNVYFELLHSFGYISLSFFISLA